MKLPDGYTKEYEGRETVIKYGDEGELVCVYQFLSKSELMDVINHHRVQRLVTQGALDNLLHDTPYEAKLSTQDNDGSHFAVIKVARDDLSLKYVQGEGWGDLEVFTLSYRVTINDGLLAKAFAMRSNVPDILEPITDLLETVETFFLG